MVLADLEKDLTLRRRWHRKLENAQPLSIMETNPSDQEAPQEEAPVTQEHESNQDPPSDSRQEISVPGPDEVPERAREGTSEPVQEEPSDPAAEQAQTSEPAAEPAQEPTESQESAPGPTSEQEPAPHTGDAPEANPETAPAEEPAPEETTEPASAPEPEPAPAPSSEQIPKTEDSGEYNTLDQAPTDPPEVEMSGDLKSYSIIILLAAWLFAQ